MRILSIFLSCLLLAAPAIAQTPPNNLAWPPHDDTITLQLSAEDYVSATSGKVTLSVSASLKDSDAAATRKEILASAQKIAKTNWRLVSFNRSTDQTGLERWDANLEARLSEAQLTGLAAAAKSTSRPGLQFTVSNTDLSPTLDEMESGRAKLRETLLAKANEDLARVNKDSGGRVYRIGNIEYGALGMPMLPRMARSMAMAPQAMMANGAVETAPANENLAVDQKIEMMATVTFATVAK